MSRRITGHLRMPGGPHVKLGHVDCRTILRRGSLLYRTETSKRPYGKGAAGYDDNEYSHVSRMARTIRFLASHG